MRGLLLEKAAQHQGRLRPCSQLHDLLWKLRQKGKLVWAQRREVHIRLQQLLAVLRNCDQRKEQSALSEKQMREFGSVCCFLVLQKMFVKLIQPLTQESVLQQRLLESIFNYRHVAH